MTPAERKAGLRAAVLAKLDGNSFASVSREIRFLWEIIDSLVDECEALRSAGKEED